MSTFALRSSWGRLVCDSATGQVRPNESVYADDPNNEQGDFPLCAIVSVDVGEWRKTYPGEDIEGEHDILDFGLTFQVGSPPDSDWRKEFRRCR